MIPLDEYIKVNYVVQSKGGRSTEMGAAIELYAQDIGKHRQQVNRWLAAGDIYIYKGERYRKLS